MNEFAYYRSRTKGVGYFTINQIKSNQIKSTQINEFKVEMVILTALTSLLRQIWGKNDKLLLILHN